MLVLLLAAGPAASQQPAALPAIGPTSPARLLQSQAAQVLPATQASLADRLRLAALRRRSRGSHALIGGLIGSAAGIVVCTAISNYVKDEGTGVSTCTTSGYVAFGVGGFAVGALVGYLIK
ncbi:MAG TPA: hypothetical protein VGQ69_12535 [Gemmatimonadales bacterium]|nr:hypothetical protein [Gemmatimonadales bacterium]